MALHQAFTLAELLAVAADHHDLAARFDAVVGEDLRDRFRAVAAEDRDRARWWGGEPIDVTDPAASMALFLRAVVYRVAPADPRLLRAVVRRIDLLDPPARLEHDPELPALALELFRGGAPPRPGPSRNHLLQALAAKAKWPHKRRQTGSRAGGRSWTKVVTGPQQAQFPLAAGHFRLSGRGHADQLMKSRG
jgi:hypothetical protein